MNENKIPVIEFRFIFLIGILLLLLSSLQLPAAGQRDEEQPQLVIWDFKYNDPRTRRVFSKIDRNFTEEHPEIELNHIGFEDEEYIPALRAALLAGTGPDIIWLHQGTEFTEYQSYLEPLDDFPTESSIAFFENSLEVCLNSEGELKALPVSYQGMGWYYNKELFRQAGLDPENPPTGWEEFLSACESLKAAGIVPIASGNNRPLSTDFIRRSLISAFFTDREIEEFYRQGRGIASAEYRLIMEFCLTLRNEGYLHPEGIHRSYFNFAPDSFGSGESAMILGLLSDIAHWRDFSDRLGTEAVGYFPNLEHPEMERPGVQLLQNAGLLIGINRNSPRKEEAKEYLRHIFSEGSESILISGLGMLVPVEGLNLPTEEYPVLTSIEEALKNTGADIEKYTPSTFVRDLTYRYDRLLINSREINIDEYIQRLYDKLKLF